jgi:hypothetical protein
LVAATLLAPRRTGRSRQEANPIWKIQTFWSFFELSEMEPINLFARISKQSHLDRWDYLFRWDLSILERDSTHANHKERKIERTSTSHQCLKPGSSKAAILSDTEFYKTQAPTDQFLLVLRKENHRE